MYLLESKSSDLGMHWSPTLQIWERTGVQLFRFGNALESNSLDLGTWRWRTRQVQTRPNLKSWTPALFPRTHYTRKFMLQYLCLVPTRLRSPLYTSLLESKSSDLGTGLMESNSSDLGTGLGGVQIFSFGNAFRVQV
jgi:hypothetical protein